MAERSNLTALLASLDRESQTILVSGVHRTGKTWMMRQLVAAHSLSRPLGYKTLVADRAGQMQPLLRLGAHLVSMADVRADKAPTWLPPYVEPWCDQGQVVVDEARGYLRDPGLSALSMLVTESGPAGLQVWLSTQDPKDVCSRVPGVAECVDWLVTGCLTGDDQLRYLQSRWGINDPVIGRLPRRVFRVYRLTPW